MEQPVLSRVQRLEARQNVGLFSTVSKFVGGIATSVVTFIRRYPTFTEEQLGVIESANAPIRDLGNFEYVDAMRAAKAALQKNRTPAPSTAEL